MPWHGTCIAVLCTCSPFVPGQVLVLTEKGGVCIYQQREEEENVTVIRVSADEAPPQVAPHMCLFGAHPDHVLWVEGGRLHSVDLRTAKVCLNGLKLSYVLVH